jgi:hypothetical protein
LEWNGSAYVPTTPASSVTFAGDLSGTDSSQTVTGIQNNPVEAISLGSAQDGYVLTWHNASSQNQWLPASFGVGVYGDGSDGIATCDGSTAVAGMTRSGSTYLLTRDVWFSNLAVNNSVTVEPAGWRIFVSGTLTNNGTIHVNGAGSLPGGGGGDGGAGGGSGQNFNTRLGGGGSGGGGNGTSVTYSMGGAGGNGYGGTGGTVTAIPAAYSSPRDLMTAINGAVMNGVSGGSVWQIISGGAGAGGFDGGEGGYYGGGGGGVMVVVAQTLAGSGAFEANGGAGAFFIARASGGGGGGFIVIVTRNTTSWTGSITATGGASGGLGGQAGAAGTVIQLTA